MNIKRLLINTSNIQKSSYIWNTAGSMLNAFQSVIILTALTRVIGLTAAGIFTIAYADANLFLNLGRYGLHNFQISDINKQFSFSEYKNTKMVTVAVMLVTAFAYTFAVSIHNDYSSEKLLIILLMYVFKTADVFEDLYASHYQQEDRLDVGAKIVTIRTSLTILAFIVLIVITKNLITTLLVCTVFTYLLLLVLIKNANEIFPDTRVHGRFLYSRVSELLKIGFPMFCFTFLSFYIGNAPKYAIDTMLNDNLQACYGFISMPVFVVGLLNNFVFNPVIFKLTDIWNQGNIKNFVRIVYRQIAIVFFITAVCLAGALLAGIPVLSWLYHTDLSNYKLELLVLMLGGGFLGLSGLLSTLLTIIRMQKVFVPIYGLVSLLAVAFSNCIVSRYMITGAALLYLTLMCILCLLLGTCLFIGVTKNHITETA